MAKRTKKTLEKILKTIPGYNPWDDKGDCWLDYDAAWQAIDFFPECLVHIKGDLAGQPFELEVWEQAIIGNLFGWKLPDGRRRYRTAFVFVARKNGKTSLSAGLVLYVLFCDGEPGAEIYSAAGEREQASIIFDISKRMIEHEPELADRCKIFQKSIVIDSSASSYKAISADAKTKHGFNSHLVVVDELHVQPNRELVDVLETSTGARSQPLIVHITTAGLYDRESICWEKYDKAVKVRDGIIKDQSFLPVIYESGKDADWQDEEIWKKANPNYGVSVSKEYFRQQHKKAIDSPAFENTFRRLHLNQWTEQDVRFLSVDQWRKSGGGLDLNGLKGRECFGGLDLASSTDLASFVLAFPGSDGIIDVLPFYWCPKDKANTRELHDNVPYLTWARQGYIKLTEGNVIDYDVIEAKIKELNEIYHIREIAVDRWQAAQIITHLSNDGFEVVPFGQGYASMSAPTKELEKLVLGVQLRHGNNPVLNWNASNISVEKDYADNYKPSKRKSIEKIDGIVALIMALGRMIVREPEININDIYNTAGI